MSKSIAFLSLMLLGGSIFGIAGLPEPQKASLEGTVTLVAKGDSLAGVSVEALANGKPLHLKKTTVTDRKGHYQLRLEPGKYTVIFQKTGYTTRRVLEVPVTKDQTVSLNAALEPSVEVESSLTVLYAVARGEAMGRSTMDVSTTAYRSTSGEPTPKPVAPAAVPPPPSTTDGRVLKEVTPVEYRAKSTEKRAYSVEEMSIKTDDAPLPASEPAKADPAKSPRAGLLTAGEWSDLHNWSRHWTDLLNDGEIDQYQKMYGFYPRHRYTVLLQNQQGFPLIDAPVQLIGSDQKVLWETRTDNTGKAELWAGLFDAQAPAPKNPGIRLILNGQPRDLGTAKPFVEGVNLIQTDQPCTTPKNVDIVWAVDATGSMGDEIEYLKTELLDVIGRVKNANPDLAVRMGTVFYRDSGDDYLVKHSALNADIGKTVQYIRQQFAGGGGDYPEAVHSALEEALQHQRWSDNAVARICFLVLDASPHQQPEVQESIRNSIRAAAIRGIRIIPVSASGIQKDTEFLMKFFGLATNGSYVFLTDHSGIGGKHLEPTTEEYKVESLNNLLVRLITEYTTVETCEGKSTIRFETTDPQQPAAAAFYYPNPVAEQFSLELPFTTDKVTLFDAEGKAVRQLNSLTQGTHQVPVNDLPPGFYTLRIWQGNSVQSGKIVVLR